MTVGRAPASRETNANGRRWRWWWWWTVDKESRYSTHARRKERAKVKKAPSKTTHARSRWRRASRPTGSPRSELKPWEAGLCLSGCAAPSKAAQRVQVRHLAGYRSHERQQLAVAARVDATKLHLQPHGPHHNFFSRRKLTLLLRCHATFCAAQFCANQWLLSRLRNSSSFFTPRWLGVERALASDLRVFVSQIESASSQPRDLVYAPLPSSQRQAEP